MNKSILSLCIALVFSAMSAFAQNYYVSPTGNNSDGSTWANAYQDLQTALASATLGDTVFVAAGTYTPHASTRTVAFDLSSAPTVIGGFAGTETPINQAVLDARDFVTNETILSGDLSGNDAASFANMTENSYHVVYIRKTSGSIGTVSVLDGFTISGGYGNNWGVSQDHKGAGIYVEATTGGAINAAFDNLVMENNVAGNGAGILIVSLNSGSVASPSFANCVIRDNQTIKLDPSHVNGGAGILVSTLDGTTNPTFDDIKIYDNEATDATGTGGAIAISASQSSGTPICNPTFTGVLIYDNVAANYSSAIATGSSGANTSCAPTFINMTIAGVSSTIPITNQHGGGTLAPSFINTIIYTSYNGNAISNYSTAGGAVDASLDHCDIKYAFGGVGSWQTALGTDAGGNTEGNPDFFDDSADDYRLNGGSPSESTGNATYGPNIGWWQDAAIIPLTITASATMDACEDTQIDFVFTLEDEIPDSATIWIVNNDSLLLPTDSFVVVQNGDTNSILINLADTVGDIDFKIFAQNNESEIDSASVVITLKKYAIDSVYLHQFQISDTSYSSVIYSDIAWETGETFNIDGVLAPTQWGTGLKAGNHFAVVELNGCASDTLNFHAPDYINNVPIEVVAVYDSSHQTFCEGDTTVEIFFQLKDDTIDHSSLIVNYHFGNLIEDDSITISRLNDSIYKIEVIIPDTSGYYQFYIHIDNIYGENANSYISFDYGVRPSVDSVTFSASLYPKHDVYPAVSNVTSQFYYQLDGGSLTSLWPGYPINNVDTGTHVLTASYGGCESAPYSFFVGHVGIEEHEDFSFSTYPNPTKDVLNIRSSANHQKNLDVKVYDAAGRLVQQDRIARLSTYSGIDVSKLTRGSYVVVIEHGNKRTGRVFVKE